MQLRLIEDEYTKMNIRLEIKHDKSLDEWIANNHYLKCTPDGARVRMAFYDISNTLVGAMMWGRPNARRLNQDKILELTRMYFIDNTPQFIESHCLGLARKYIRKNMNQIKGLLSYSSQGEGHEGTIYEADGWFQLGVMDSKSASWETRDGRRDRDNSNKIRWVRSP